MWLLYIFLSQDICSTDLCILHARPHIVNRIHKWNKIRMLVTYFLSFAHFVPFAPHKNYSHFPCRSLHLTQKSDDLNFARMARNQLRNNHVNKSVTANECTLIKNVVPNAFWKSFVFVGVQTNFDTDSKFGAASVIRTSAVDFDIVAIAQNPHICVWRERKGEIAHMCKFIRFDIFFIHICSSAHWMGVDSITKSCLLFSS